MPTVRHARKLLHLKVVYYGPGLCGKTTNLELLHQQTKPENRGRLISLMTDAERTLFFDLLPVTLGSYRGYGVRLHLCTVPGQVARDDVRKLVLRNADVVVFVVDSQEGRMDANVTSLENLAINVALMGIEPSRMPMVVQYNKRDLPTAMSIAELRTLLSIPADVVQIEASAVSGLGVTQTLRAAVRAALSAVGDPTTYPEGRTPSILPGHRPSMFPATGPEMVQVEIPKSPLLPSGELS